MSFGDSVAVEELRLGSRISFWAEHGETITGKVIGLGLLGDDMRMVQVTLQMEPNGSVCDFDFAPDRVVTLEW